MREINLDYIAGFFDGEGNIYYYERARTMTGGWPKQRYGHRITFYNTNKEVLLQIKDFLKMGASVYRRHDGRGHKVEWRLQICKRREIEEFIELFADRLRVKRDELLGLKRFLEEHPRKANTLEYWTEKEILQLKKLYPQGVPVKQIARKLRRSELSVRNKACRLKLRRR